MEIPKKLQYTQTKFQQTQQKITALLDRIKAAECVTTDIESEANMLILDVKELSSIVDEFEMALRVAYFDRQAFQLSDEQLQQLDLFFQQNTEKIHKFDTLITKELQFKRDEHRRKQNDHHLAAAAQQTKANIMNSQKDAMDEFTSAGLAGVKEIKNTMLDVKDGLDKGKITSDILQKKVEENVDDNKLANTKVGKARAAMKKNKDWIFMWISLGVCVAQVCVLIWA